MESESEIFSDVQANNFHMHGSSPHLIREGAIFSYYRIEHDGKYFFFKTFTQDTSLGRLLLRREYDLGVHCDNPYIPHIFLFGEYVNGKEGILMEYVDGRSLSEFLGENPSPAERKKIFSQILDAIGYLHTRGIIHNDLKPDNILIKRTGNNVALIDFGMADNDAHFLMKTPGCTTEFAAPELIKSRVSDVRSDIYSIGKLMGLLFGKRYRRFSNKCIRENPSKRYSSVADLKKAWEGRHKPFRITGAAIALLLAATTVWLYLAEKSEQTRHLQEMGKELDNQKSLNALQTQKFMQLQASYSEVNDNYQGMTESYQNMRDSLDESTKISLDHEKARKKAIDGFKAGLNKRMYATFDSIKLCSTYRQMNLHRQIYDTTVRTYFANYPKIADGEDITGELSALLNANLEESRLLFNTELARVRDNKTQNSGATTDTTRRHILSPFGLPLTYGIKDKKRH